MVKIHACLDTNIYLSFYHFSDNDLQKLEQILALIEEDELNILLPSQIKNEFIRNREIKISDALKKIRSLNIDFQLPRLTDTYEETKELYSIFREYSLKKANLIDKLENDINHKSLKADILIEKIFEKAELIELTEDLRQASKKRFDLWNPPWKDKSYWDAIIREIMLNYWNGNEIIDFISIDWDYSCSLDNNKLNNFLQEEQKKYRSGEILFYSTLNSFFETRFPWIKIDEEYRKNKYIEKFENSDTFDTTRMILYKIIKYENYSIDQINRIIDAAISNNQIYRANDYSARIWEKLIKLVSPYFSRIEEDKLLSFLYIYDKELYKQKNDWL